MLFLIFKIINPLCSSGFAIPKLNRSHSHVPQEENDITKTPSRTNQNAYPSLQDITKKALLDHL